MTELKQDTEACEHGRQVSGVRHLAVVLEVALLLAFFAYLAYLGHGG